MPLIVVRLTEDCYTPEQRLEMAQRLADAMASIHGDGMRPYVRVIIEGLHRASWKPDGKPLRSVG